METMGRLHCKRRSKKLLFNKWGPCRRCFRFRWKEAYINKDGIPYVGEFCARCNMIRAGTLERIPFTNRDAIWKAKDSKGRSVYV